MARMACLFLLLTGCIADLQDSRFRGSMPTESGPSVVSCEWSCDQVYPWVAIPTEENAVCRSRCGSE
jgi:hypothetical protein